MMTLGQRTKLLCQKYGIRPNQRLGQHFLIDQNVLRKIVAVADLHSADRVLEVGPGFGVLTEALLDAGCQVLTIEQDRRFEPALKTLAAVSPGLRYVIGDVMRIDLAQEFAQGVYAPCKVVSNLPYQISSEFLRLILTGLPSQPVSATLLLQREVAERIMAKSGQMSLLALSVQLYADVKIVAKVSPAAFWPRPEVESAVVHLATHGLEVPEVVLEAFGIAAGKSPPPSLLVRSELPPSPRLRRTGRRAGQPPLAKGGEGGRTAIAVIEKQLWRMLRVGFSAKRKQLHHNLTSGLVMPPERVRQALARAGVGLTARAQELDIEAWWKLLGELIGVELVNAHHPRPSP